MAKEQDMIKLFRITDMQDTEKVAVVLSKNFNEIENHMSLLQGYVKEVTGGSVADLVSSGLDWTHGVKVDCSALIAVTINGEVADGALQGYFQAAAPASGMAYGDIWIDTDLVVPPDTTCIFRYEDDGGGATGTLGWKANSYNAVGNLFLDASNAGTIPGSAVKAFFQGTVPTGLNVGDYWINTADCNKMYRAASSGADIVGRGEWEAVRDAPSTTSAATFVVSDGSTTNDTKKADFIVPVGSTNAEITIQKALDALPATGGRVMLLDGTYTISNSIILDSNQTLEGQGLNTLIKCSDTFSSVQPGIICADTKSNIELWSFTLEGNWDNLTNSLPGIYCNACTDVLLCALAVTKAYGRGIHFYLGSDITISNCTISYCATYGIDLDSLKKTTVAGCNVSHNGSYGISASRVSASYGYCEDCSITGNIVTYNTRDGIYVSGGQRHVISANICSFNEEGVALGASTLECVVSNNTTTFNQNNGLRCIGDYCIVTGNMISTNSQEEDNVHDNLYVGGTYNNVQNNTCRTGDTSFDAKYGIYISGDYCLVTNNDSKNGGQTDDLLDNGTGNVLTAGNRL